MDRRTFGRLLAGAAVAPILSPLTLPIADSPPAYPYGIKWINSWGVMPPHNGAPLSELTNAKPEQS